MRSVSRPTSALTPLRARGEVAGANRALDPPHVMQQIAEREQAVEQERVHEPRQSQRDTALAAATNRDDRAEPDAIASATKSRMPPP